MLVAFTFQSLSESVQKRFLSVFDINNLGIQYFGFSGLVLLVLQCKWVGMSAVLCWKSKLKARNITDPFEVLPTSFVAPSFVPKCDFCIYFTLSLQ